MAKEIAQGLTNGMNASKNNMGQSSKSDMGSKDNNATSTNNEIQNQNDVNSETQNNTSASSMGGNSENKNSEKNQNRKFRGGGTFKYNNNTEDTADELQKTAAMTANSAIAVGKATAKAAAGDVVGAVVEVAKDEGLRTLIIGVVVLVVVLPIMMFSAVPNVLFQPSEEAYGTDTNASLIDIIKGWFSNDDEEAELLAVSDDDIASLISDGMKNEESLTLIANNTDEFVDFEVAPENADVTMQKMLSITKNTFNKRHKDFLEVINKDYNSRKGKYSDAIVSQTVIDAANLFSDKNAAELMCLYTIQTDGYISGKSFHDYLSWLGEPDTKLFFFTEKMEGYDDWYAKPSEWNGTMLPQIKQDEVTKAKEEGVTDEEIKESYKEFYTSAINELVVLDPKIDITQYTEEITDDKGNKHNQKYVNITYNITSKTIEDLYNDVIKLDEAVTYDENGEASKLDNAANREEYYKELVETTLSYFGISKYNAYFSGSGKGIVQVALNEVGIVETGNNRVKYNDWYWHPGASGDDYPWCCAFVSWCANECGYIDAGIIPKTAGCAVLVDWYKSNPEKGTVVRISQADSAGFTPMPGDLIVRSYNGSIYKHIGIVKEYDSENKVLYTVEGNSGPGISSIDNNGGCVGEHAYGENPPAQKTIIEAWGSYGVYVRPNYPVSDLIGGVNIPEGLGKVHTYTPWNNFVWKYDAGNLIKYLGGRIGTGGSSLGGSITKNTKAFIGYGDWYAGAMVKYLGGHDENSAQMVTSAGDMMFIIQDDGSFFPFMIADHKVQFNVTQNDDNPANEWGHNNGRCVVEFEMWGNDSSRSEASNAEPRFNHYITQVYRVGNAYDNPEYITNIDAAIEAAGLDKSMCIYYK